MRIVKNMQIFHEFFTLSQNAMFIPNLLFSTSDPDPPKGLNSLLVLFTSVNQQLGSMGSSYRFDVVLTPLNRIVFFY